MYDRVWKKTEFEGIAEKRAQMGTTIGQRKPKEGGRWLGGGVLRRSIEGGEEKTVKGAAEEN